LYAGDKCLGYKLGIQDKGITEIRDLSEKEYQDYKKASNSLFDFSKDQQLYTIVLLNYDDFLNIIQKYTKEYAENPQLMNLLIMEKMVLNINRHILNFLSSVRSFLDHTETKLKRNYGAESDRYKRFKDACKKVYDTSFSYRFLSKLRNYSQHCGMPLGGLSLRSKEDPPYSGNIYHSLQAKFSRDELLTYTSWGTIAKEISQLPSEFDIVPHIVQMMKCLEKINLVLIDDDLPELFKSAEFIEQLISPAQGKEGVPCILQFLDINQDVNGKVKQMKVRIAHIPLHIIEIVNNIRKEKASQNRP
jgi:hypothetical protein